MALSGNLQSESSGKPNATRLQSFARAWLHAPRRPWNTPVRPYADLIETPQPLESVLDGCDHSVRELASDLGEGDGHLDVARLLFDS